MTPHTGPVTQRATCVLAPNPSPMTLEGTNTWILAEPGDERCLVVDPGPADEAHLDAVRAEVGSRTVEAVLLTHAHADHSAGAAAFAACVDAPVRGGDAGGLDEGAVVTAGGLTVEVLATPGHTGDSVSLLVPADAALLSGDTVLGRGTTVVAWPDGRLGDYLDSLTRLLAFAEAGRVQVVLPGHGAPVLDPVGTLRSYLRHREERLDQVRAALAAGADDVESVLKIVYADTPRELWPAAARSVEAQLHHLRAEHPRG